MAQGLLRSNKTRDGIAGALAYQIGDLEEDQYQIRQEWTAQHSQFNDMQDALEQAGLRVLTKPNLIKQNWWTTGTGVDHLVVYGKAARIASSTGPYLTSHGAPTETTQTTEPTAEQKAAATSIYSTTEGGVTTYHIFTDNDDFKATVAELASEDQITETDGTVLTKAINFDITENSAYGNTEWLLYNYCNTTRVYIEGDTNVKNWGQIEEMEPGYKYSASCWVRVLSGDGVWMKMGYGTSLSNQPRKDEENHRSDVSDWIKVDALNGVWQRVSWTFDYNPVGDWYTESSNVVDNVTKVTRTYNWFKKIGFAVARKYTGTVQICGFRLVRGKTYTCETYDDLHGDLTDARERVVALEAEVPAAKSALLAIIAESDSATATANHAVGELFVMGDVLYKTTAAIATGETITPGTNCSATTLAAEIEAAAASTPDLSAYAPKASPAFTGSISMGRQAGTTVGLRSVAAGNNAAATGNYSGAIGNYTVAGGNGAVAVGNKSEASGNNSFASGEQTIANHRSQVAFGEYNVQDPNTTYTGRGTYAEIVGNGTSNSARSNARTLDWNGNEWLAGNLTLGNTTLTEAQLQALLALLS